MHEPRGRYSRGYLPHIEAGQRAQLVTWRLRDSIPAELLRRWDDELQPLDTSARKAEWRKRIESHLDAGSGSRLLANPVAARIVHHSLIFGHPERYVLHAWVVMPTHVHALLTPQKDWTLSRILQGIKSYTSHEINKTLGRQGEVWQPEYFDTVIRDEHHFQRALKYVEWNPVKAGLCPAPEDYAFGSANPIAWEKLSLKA